MSILLVLKVLEICTLPDPRIPLLRIYFKEIIKDAHKDLDARALIPLIL